MKSEQLMLTRRSIIAATLAGALFPRAALGQVPAHAEGASNMKIQCTFAGQTFTATLYDNPSARDFAAMLPLDLDIEDYSTNEKIAYLPRKLTENGSGPFSNEQPGDLCYYAPWGNLAFFHAGYRYSRGLIRLGRLDAGVEPLLKRGKFQASSSASACRSMADSPRIDGIPSTAVGLHPDLGPSPPS
jgi:hypothetical protein